MSVARFFVTPFFVFVQQNLFAQEVRTFPPVQVSTPSERTLKGAFSGQSNQLAQGSGEDIGNRYNAQLDLNYKSEGIGKLNKKFTFSGNINDAELFMFSIKEAYLSNHKTRSFHYKIGRARLDWSRLDKIWGFGKLNNRVNFNFFDHGQEGLTGFHFKKKFGNSGFRLKGFGSYFYIPELNPSLDINEEEGTITSRHPWAKAPAATFDEIKGPDGGPAPVFYQVEYPDYQDIIFNESIGFDFGWENRHFEISAFYMRKPENTISIAAQPKVDLTSSSAKVDISPGIFYQDVIGGKFEYKNRKFMTYASILASYPNDSPEADEKFYRVTKYKQVKIKEEYGGLGFSYGNDFSMFGLNYVVRRSRFEEDRDNFLQEEPRWNEAVNFFISQQFTRKLKARADVKYDVMTDDRLFSFETLYKATAKVNVSAGFNIIGASSTEETFWSPFRNNDSVYGKMSFLF